MTAGEGDLVFVVYASTAVTSFRESALAQLLAESRRKNSARGITGMLLYRDGRFIQVLEGEKQEVEDLVDTIRRDVRHRDVRVLLDGPLSQRTFSEWTMGYRAFRGDASAAPDGHRDSFSDLDGDADDATTVRALAELTLWFRVRAGRERAHPAS